MRYLLVFALFLLPLAAHASVASNVSGRIVLDVEQNGEAWYVNLVDLRRHYLGRPDDAFAIMRSLGLGISNNDFSRLPYDSALRQRLAGRILIKVQDYGKAYYVHPVTLERHYLGRAADAFTIMSSLGLGISSSNLAQIPVAGTTASTTYISGVPFTAQAPFGDWGDIRQQEACEEASALMAYHWLHGDTTLTQQEALDEILAITNWEQAAYGYHHDTSAADTADRILHEWFGVQNLNVYHDINTQDMIDELDKGHLVLVPIHGSTIGNPHYSGPVERHMIVVNGYDAATDEFITHDPGTRFGNDIRFTRTNMERSLRDYTSGVYAPIGAGRTAMIVIWK